MKKRRILDDVFRFTTAVGESTAFTGSFAGGESFVIRGKVTGDSEVAGAMVIAESGIWIGRIKAEVVFVAGRVEGEIDATEKLEILSTAHIKGRICCPLIAMAIGAVHEGEIHMHEKSMVTEFTEKRTTSSDPNAEQSEAHGK